MSWKSIVAASHLVAVAVMVGFPVCEAAELRLSVAVAHPDADGGMAANRLRLVTAAQAGNGFDPALDLEAFPAPALSAVIRHAEYPSGQQSLWWDVRPEVLPQTWNVEVSSDQPDALVTIRGAFLSAMQSGCSASAWTLRDEETGQVLNLTAGMTDYSYRNTVGVPRRFEIVAAQGSALPPQIPVNVWSPRQGRTNAYVAWSGAGDPSITYHVYRETDQGTTRLTSSPIAATSYVDTGLDRTRPVSYHVTAVTGSGCESPQSDGPRLMPRR